MFMRNYWLCLAGLLLISTTLTTVSSTDIEDTGSDVNEPNDVDGENEPDDVVSDEVRVEDSVLVLSEKNFDDTVEKHKTLLVEFYAPWCGHCKKLTPEYAAAAAVLAENDPPVALAKVDVTVNSGLGQRFEVQGYPTLRFFKDGNDYPYDGPRTKDGIVQYMKKRASPDWEPEPDAVVTLTGVDFDDVISREDLILVEFYAPWCGHCKQLAPIYEKAAKMAKAMKPPIIFAKVDATKETELARQYNIEGYPTLKIFKKDKAIEYKGGLKNEYDFISTIKKFIGDGAQTIKDLKKLKQAFSKDDITIVGFFNREDDLLAKPYKDLADEFREDYKFGIIYDKAARNNYKINPGSVVVFNPEWFYTKFEPKWYVLELKEKSTTDDIKKFIQKHDVPLVGNYIDHQITRYDTRRPLCIVFYTVDFSVENRKATQLWRNKIAGIAKKYPDITFAIADDEENTDLMASFGLAESNEDMNIGLIGEDKKKYGMEPMEEFDSEEIDEFLSKYKKGKLKLHVKSQRVPKKQSGPVTVVVGDNFETVVLDTQKDVLIEMYAPWCGHCKKLEPIYALLAKKMKNEKNLVIAKMDATANDTPDNFRSSGFPTIYFAPADKKNEPVLFEGDREIEDFEKFLKKHATVSFGKGEKDEL